MFSNTRWFVLMFLASFLFLLVSIVSAFIAKDGLLAVIGIFSVLAMLGLLTEIDDPMRNWIRGQEYYPAERIVWRASETLLFSVVNVCFAAAGWIIGNPSSFTVLVAYFATLFLVPMLLGGWFGTWVAHIKKVRPDFN